MLPHLGDELKAVRTVRGLSLQAVAEPAGVSVSYLQKLEHGRVNNPSPRVLRRLAGRLDVGYLRLLHLAGYLTPDELAAAESGGAGHGTDAGGVGVLRDALLRTPLSDDEQRAVAAFVTYLLDLRPRDAGGGGAPETGTARAAVHSDDDAPPDRAS